MRSGWTPERRARQASTIARRQVARAVAARDGAPAPEHQPLMPVASLAAIVPVGRVDPVEALVLGMQRQLDELRDRVTELEARPPVREWRPDHRRGADGGEPVRAQRRAVGLPPRPRRIA